MTTVFYNATVHTLDDALGSVTTFAVADGRMVAVGAQAVEELSTVTDWVDLNGQTVIPGIVDVHNHHMVAGKADLFEFNAPPTLTAEQLLTAIETYASQLPDGAWLVGGSFGADLFAQLDSVAMLQRFDEATRGHPAVLSDDSLHNRWANTVAMQLANITEATTDPRGGHISRDAQGRATGVLYEAAGVLVTQAKERFEPSSIDDLAKASARGIEMLHEYGITGFQDAAASSQLQQALKTLDERNELNAWVVTSSPVEEFIFGIEPVGEEIIFSMERSRSQHHRPDFIKIFLDGVPPTKTAAFLEPYIADSDCSDCNFGYLTMPSEELTDWLMKTAHKGISAKIHCTGDASVRAVLDAVEMVREAGYTKSIYHVAHGQFIHPDDIARFQELGVVADISPALWFPNVITESFKTVLPAERAEQVQPNRALLDHGALVAAGSDWPVAESPDPWPAMYGLVTRQDPTGTMPGALWPEQAVTRREALAMYTRNPALALGMGETIGTLSPGKSADFVVLNLDPLVCRTEELLQIHTQQTWFAGSLVYNRQQEKIRDAQELERAHS